MFFFILKRFDLPKKGGRVDKKTFEKNQIDLTNKFNALEMN